jgi:hypothetical protein
MANMKTEAMVAEASRKLEDGIRADLKAYVNMLEDGIRADLKAYVNMLEEKIAALADRVEVLEEGEPPHTSA